MSTALAVLPDMTTAEGLIDHYSAVKVRLNGKASPAAVKRSLVYPPTPATVYPRVRHEYLFIDTVARTDSGRRCLRSAINAERIIQHVSETHGVSIAMMKGSGRSKPVVAARWEVYHRLQLELGYSLPMIGDAMGGKEHTGVMHGITMHMERMARAERIAQGSKTPREWVGK